MRKIDESYFDKWGDAVIESIVTGKSKILTETLSKYIPFKVKKRGSLAYYAEFTVDLTDGRKLKYNVTVGKTSKRGIASDYGKVKSKFSTIMFKEAGSGYGIATLPGNTGMYVLNTVARVILNFIEEAKPSGFTFSASEPSRRKAYRALTLMLEKRSGYVNITKKKAMEDGNFYLMRKDLFESWQDAVNQSGIS